MPLEARNILVTRTDRIGDVILSLPVAAAIKGAMPRARVTFMVTATTAPIVRTCPWVDDTLVVKTDFGGAALVDDLRSRRFDAAVCLYPRSKLAILLQRVRIPIRVGTARRFYSYRFNRRINFSRRSGGRHERDCNLALLRGLGIRRPQVLDPLCIPLHEALTSARILLGELGLEPGRQRLAVVHPGCGGSARNWLPERYRQLCRLLSQQGNGVVVSGSADEKGLVETVTAGIGDGVTGIAGKTDLPLLAAILKLADVFVGPSTGPMHLAAAVGTPVVALFGPVRTTTPDRWGPLGEGHRVFIPPVDTCRCPLDQCKVGDCMAMIDPGAVAGAAMETIGQPPREFSRNSGVFEFKRN